MQEFLGLHHCPRWLGPPGTPGGWPRLCQVRAGSLLLQAHRRGSHPPTLPPPEAPSWLTDHRGWRAVTPFSDPWPTSLCGLGPHLGWAPTWPPALGQEGCHAGQEGPCSPELLLGSLGGPRGSGTSQVLWRVQGHWEHRGLQLPCL